jgi:hypothetical protein
MADRRGAKSWWLRASVTGVSAALMAAAAQGCSASPEPPAVYITASVEDQSIGGGMCSQPSLMPQLFTVFGAGDDAGLTGIPNMPISNGETFGGMPAQVSCTVSQNGSGFTVDAKVTTASGTFTLQSTTPWPAMNTATPGGVTISYGSMGVLYAGTGCTVTYATVEQTTVPIAAGRVWGTFDCPMMTQGNGTQFVCEGAGTFQLTNCTE